MNSHADQLQGVGAIKKIHHASRSERARCSDLRFKTGSNLPSLGGNIMPRLRGRGLARQER